MGKEQNLNKIDRILALIAAILLFILAALPIRQQEPDHETAIEYQVINGITEGLVE